MWTIAHAFLTVFITFSLGLFLAIILNAKFMPGRAVLRTALLVPYAIPAFISVLVWKGLLNEQLGVINKTINSVLGIDGPGWTSSATWVKVGILLVQLWLGFPYMLLICTGALQSIPHDIYEAARVDGANVLQQFRHLTLPLLLVAVGPLLIASFAFNFNNFTVVELFNKGGPPIAPDTAAGHSDILITTPTIPPSAAGASGLRLRLDDHHRHLPDGRHDYHVQLPLHAIVGRFRKCLALRWISCPTR